MLCPRVAPGPVLRTCLQQPENRSGLLIPKNLRSTELDKNPSRKTRERLTQETIVFLIWALNQWQFLVGRSHKRRRQTKSVREKKILFNRGGEVFFISIATLLVMPATQDLSRAPRIHRLLWCAFEILNCVAGRVKKKKKGS